MRLAFTALAAALLIAAPAMAQKPVAPDEDYEPVEDVEPMEVEPSLAAPDFDPRIDSMGDGTGGRELRPGAANLDFILVNSTGRMITGVSISPAGEESWSDDILVPRDLPPDERGAASYTRDYEMCEWDLRVTYEGGGHQSWPRVDLCDTVRVEVR